MNVELKPIAESKVRQLGGDVCGVLVRTEDGVMAVSEHGRCTRLDAGVMGPVDGAQGAQGAGVVAWEASAPSGKRLFRDKAKAEKSAEVYGGGARPLVYGDAQPHPAVPEEMISLVAICQHLRDHIDERGTSLVCHRGVTLFIDALQNAEAVTEALLSTPTTPQADGWVRCEDRLPTYRDSDEYGDVWAMSKLYGVKKMSWSSVRADFESHWMPTGLKRPDIPRC